MIKQTGRRITLLIFGVALIVWTPIALWSFARTTNRALDTFPRWVGEQLGVRTSWSAIAPLFTEEVDHWRDDLRRWSAEYDLDPNLLATVMQIESCGYPTVGSSAGAQGLFQVMPFHFEAGEDQVDPDTNAKRGALFLQACLGYADGDVGLALACYNGGPGVIGRPFNQWAAETQRYYNWGTRIYADSTQNLTTSPALQDWLNAGGQVLCDRAASALGIG